MKVFVSYRREDRPAVASLVTDRLRRQFGPDDVFKDIDAIDDGENFLEKIQAALTAADVLLVVIGPGWLNASKRPGKRRLDDPDDWVRIEVREGLQREDVRVVPLLVDGAEMPGEDQLPPGLKALAYRNARVLRPGPEFESDLETLAGRLAGTTDGQDPLVIPPEPIDPVDVRPAPHRRSVLEYCTKAGLWGLPRWVFLVVPIVFVTLVALLIYPPHRTPTAPPPSPPPSTPTPDVKIPPLAESFHRLMALKSDRPDEAIRIWIMLVGSPSEAEVAGLANGAEKAGAVVEKITHLRRLTHAASDLAVRKLLELQELATGRRDIVNAASSSSYRGDATEMPSAQVDAVAVLGEPGSQGQAQRELIPERIVWVCNQGRDVYVAPSASPWERWPTAGADNVVETVRRTARVVVPRGEAAAADFGRFLQAVKSRKPPDNGVRTSP